MKKIIIVLNLLFIFNFQSTYGQKEDKNYKKGLKYFDNKEYEKAISCFDKVYKKYPTNEVKFRIAHSYANMSDIKQAKPLFLEIINNKPEDLELSMSLLNLGTCYRELKQNDSAYYYYETKIKLFPKYAEAYFDLGLMYFSERKFAEATENFNKAILLDSSNSAYFSQRMYTCFAIQDYNCALKDMNTMKKMIPGVKLEPNIAYCYTMLSMYNEADSVFKLIYDENSSSFMNNYGYNKYLMGDTIVGKGLIMKSLNLDPNNSFSYRNLALIAIIEKDDVKICEYLNKAESLGFEKNYGDEVKNMIKKYCK